jgi:tetratricopeptide (TPR) repeat protein
LDPLDHYELLSASDQTLGKFVDLTGGNPRALLAIGTILESDREATVAEILAGMQAAVAPDAGTPSASVRSVDAELESAQAARAQRVAPVVDALIGESYSRLDRDAQRVLQALAVFERAVPVGAVDYLLQPYVSGLDAQQVLSQLVHAQLVQQESRGYYLHPVDREYSLRQLAPVAVASNNSQSASHYDMATLQQRAADWFASIRRTRAEWKSLSDLQPQLDEIDIRCSVGEYSAAYVVLREITFDFLLLWGKAQLTLDLHKRLSGHLTDRHQMQWNAAYSGMALRHLGRVTEAINCYQQALEQARAIPDRQGEGAHLGNLGNAYKNLGDARRAIEYYEQALEISREIGDRRHEGNWLGNLGNVYKALGDARRAIEYYEQTIEIEDEVEWPQAQQCFRFEMARSLIDQPALDRALGYAERACEFDVPVNNAEAFLVLGIVQLHRGQTESARQAYQKAMEHAKHLLDQCADNYDANDQHGLAFCGLVACGDPAAADAAAAAFHRIRELRNQLPGYRDRRLREFDQLAAAVSDATIQESLAEIRIQLAE